MFGIAFCLFSALVSRLKIGSQRVIRQGDDDAGFADATLSAHCEDDALGGPCHCSPQ